MSPGLNLRGQVIEFSELPAPDVTNGRLVSAGELKVSVPLARDIKLGDLVRVLAITEATADMARSLQVRSDVLQDVTVPLVLPVCEFKLACEGVQMNNILK